MRIYIASDHAGFELKKVLLAYIKNELSHEPIDNGAYVYNPEDDYTDFILPVAKKVADEGDCLGIILGKSGQGEAMEANRLRGVRAAVYYGGNPEIIRLSREHNDSNILSLGAGFLSGDEAKEAVKLWLSTPFLEKEKYQRRIDKMDL